jgi:hypothetical protein
MRADLHWPIDSVVQRALYYLERGEPVERVMQLCVQRGNCTASTVGQYVLEALRAQAAGQTAETHPDEPLPLNRAGVDGAIPPGLVLSKIEVSHPGLSSRIVWVESQETDTLTPQEVFQAAWEAVSSIYPDLPASRRQFVFRALLARRGAGQRGIAV